MKKMPGDASSEDASTLVPDETGRTCVLVLGMHRSGTSAVTRIFSLLGCDLPANLMGATKTNEAGHWESVPICQLNDRLLESAGSCWHDWQAFNPGWLRSPKAQTFREEALSVLEQEFGNSRLFVLKDPRICRLVPFWLDVLAGASVRPLVVLPLRNPLEVAASLQKRNGFELAFGHLLWLRHVLEAEVATRGLPRIFLSYDSMLRSWARVVERAEEQFRLSLPRKSSTAIAEIETFLSDKLRHHKEAPESVVENPTLSRWLRDSYRILSRWIEKGEDTADHAALDAILAEFDAATPAFALLADAGHAAIGRARRLEDDLEQNKAELAEARKAAAQMEEAFETVERAAADTRAELQQTKSALEQRRHEAEETAEALKQTREKLADAEAARQKAEEAHTQARQEAEAARQEAEQAAALNRDLSTRLDTRFNEIAEISRLLRAREAEVEAGRLRTEQVASQAATELGRAITAVMDNRRHPFFWAGARMRRAIAIVQRSGLFDAEWYLRHYTDVAEAGIDPIKHYVLFGAREGRHPNGRLKS